MVRARGSVWLERSALNEEIESNRVIEGSNPSGPATIAFNNIYSEFEIYPSLKMLIANSKFIKKIITMLLFGGTTMGYKIMANGGLDAGDEMACARPATPLGSTKTTGGASRITRKWWKHNRHAQNDWALHVLNRQVR